MPIIKVKTVMDDIVRFRHMMGDKRNTLETLEECHTNLLAAYVMAASTRRDPEATDEEIEQMQHAMEAVTVGWEMRSTLMTLKPLDEMRRDLRETISVLSNG